MKNIINLFLFFTLSCVVKADSGKVVPVVLATNQLGHIQREYTDAEINYHKAEHLLSDAPDKKVKAKELSKKFNQQQADLLMSAVELARNNPKSEMGFAALNWVVNSGRAAYLPVGVLGLEMLTQQYVDDPKIGGLIANLSYYLSVDEESFISPAVMLMNAVIEKNPDRTARGQSALGLAWLAKRKFNEESNTNSAAEMLAKQAEEAFKSVMRDYRDCPNLRTDGHRPPAATLGGEAEPELYELQHLRIGQAAPEIAGEDLTGTGLKLSDYRGKVVLLVFWASWCGPCISEIPHEKELVEHFKDRPFVLVGVSGDGDKGNATKAVAKYQIPWRTFWDGPEDASGPIVVGWNVRSWPTSYILDQQGVIRHKKLFGKRLDDSVEQLVSAVENEKQ